MTQDNPSAHDGLMRNADTGHLIGIEQVPVPPHPAVGSEYPKMLYSREHHAVDGVAASIYDKRNDFFHAIVVNEEEAEKLGGKWFDDPSKLPAKTGA